MARFLIHYGIHFLVPVAIAFLFYKDKKWKALGILWCAMVIDLDHLLADPICHCDK